MARSKTTTTEVNPKVKVLKKTIKEAEPEVKINETKPKEAESKPKEPESKPKEPESKPKEPESKPKEPESKPKEPESKPNDIETKPKEPESKQEEVEPVKGKRGRKSKKELMAALGVAPEMIVTNSNNMILSVTELPEKENISSSASNIIIISNPNLESKNTDHDDDDEDGEAVLPDAKQVTKKRGRKPKGGKIIQQVIPVDAQINDKPNVILHLKCSMKDLQNSMNSNNIESYTFNQKNNLCYDVIGSENINSVNNYFNDKNNMSSNTLKTQNNSANNCFNDYDDDDDDSTNKDATKEIWKKLKQLEHNLHINNVNNKKSACFWDSCDFDNPPIYIPKHFINGTYHVYGCFCSPECGVAYLMNENIDSSTKFERYHLFNHIYSKIYDYKKNIKPSPNPHYMLEKFYGNLSIQEYRSLLRNERLFIIVDKPLTRILPELHDDNDDFILNSKIIPSNNNYQLKSRMQKKKTNKNSILNEKFGLNQKSMINNDDEFVSYVYE
jgi:hypothetical protein